MAQRLRVATTLLGLVLACTAIVGCQQSELPDPELQRDRVAKLTALLRVVAGNRIVSWEDSDSCRSIDYARGSFQDDTDDGLSCFSSAMPPAPFDAIALADHSRVADSIDDLGLDGLRLAAVSYDGDRPVSGVFFVGPCETYFLDALGALQPVEGTGPTRVNDDWLVGGSDGFPCSDPFEDAAT